MRLFWTLLKNNLRSELMDPVKFISSVFFSLTLLFLFSISIGELEGVAKAPIISAQIFLGKCARGRGTACIAGPCKFLCNISSH